MESTVYNSNSIINIPCLKDIPEIVCINLKSRPDRKEQFLKNFPEYPIRFYIAEKHKDPKRGCMESHINCIKWAKEQGLSSIMIFEDDAEIIRDLNELPSFPDDWSMIYLGALATKIIKEDAAATKIIKEDAVATEIINKDALATKIIKEDAKATKIINKDAKATKIIKEVTYKKNGWIRGHYMCNHAYIVRDMVYDEIIEKGWVYKNGTIDDFLVEKMHHKINAYARLEPYIIQSDGYSDLDNKNMKWRKFKWPNVGDDWTMP